LCRRPESLTNPRDNQETEKEIRHEDATGKERTGSREMPQRHERDGAVDNAQKKHPRRLGLRRDPRLS
jgi:hypothetical protein